MPDIRASAQRPAESPPTGSSLPGHQWRAGLNAWLQDHATPNLHDCRSRLELAPEGLTRWLFQDVCEESELCFGDSLGLRAHPLQVMAAVLAPLAGLDPAQHQERLKRLGEESFHPEAPGLARTQVVRLLCALFGDTPHVFKDEQPPLPQNLHDVRYWAALGEGGELWVSDTHWGEAGAFLLRYPCISQHDSDDTTQRLMWDSHFEQFCARDRAPLVFCWPEKTARVADAPWVDNTRHPAASMADLLIAPQFAALHALSSPQPNHVTDTVMFSTIDPVRRRALGYLQQQSALLCHSEAWLAGIRFEKLRREEIGPTAALDAAGLLSVISTTVNQCPVEKRLMGMLRDIRRENIHWAALDDLPQGEWMEGMIEDLLQARCHSAFATVAPDDLAPVLDKGVESGTLKIWMTDTPGRSDTGLGLRTRQLNIHAVGPLFGPRPMRLRRDFIEAHQGWLGCGLRVVSGESLHLSPGTAHLVFNLLPAAAHAPLTLENRSQTQRAFWNTVLDFNSPSTHAG